MKQIWYADHATGTACGKISNLKTWWDETPKKGPEYGYILSKRGKNSLFAFTLPPEVHYIM